MKIKSFNNLIILFIVLIIVIFLYKKYEDKIYRETSEQNGTYDDIKKYLLDASTLEKSKKPILWIHVPYEYNSRNWLNFGSRSSFDLNQPYLYLTFRSIIKYCDKSFTICIIDDNSFKKLMPMWNIDLNYLSNPILENIRILGLMKLLYTYGGMVCPISFLCMKDLIDLYYKGTRENKMFLCELIDKNTTSTSLNFYPNLEFCGASKECDITFELINYIEGSVSIDYTSESKFLGKFDSWCMKKIEKGQINLIDGIEVGTKTFDKKPIIIDDLISNNYLKIYDNNYGIYINSREILNRNKYQWFARLSEKQVLESNTIIGNYILLSVSPSKEKTIIEPLKVKPNWVAFWKTPLYPGLWTIKPNFLGDNINRVKHSGR